MKGNWVIIHDNGVVGQRGFSDWYGSESEVLSEIAALKNCGCTVFDYFLFDYSCVE